MSLDKQKFFKLISRVSRSVKKYPKGNTLQYVLQVKIQFEGDKMVSGGNVATAVKGLGLEPKVT
ncbi:unnamed protein product, partial [marine sediment metagenome]